VPGGCISNLKTLHKSYIAKLFLNRGFAVFRWVKKKFCRDFLAIFVPILKKTLKNICSIIIQKKINLTHFLYAETNFV